MQNHQICDLLINILHIVQWSKLSAWSYAELKKLSGATQKITRFCRQRAAATPFAPKKLSSAAEKPNCAAAQPTAKFEHWHCTIRVSYIVFVFKFSLLFATLFRVIIFGMCFKKSLCCKCTQLVNQSHLAMIHCIKINICTKIFIHILHYQVYATQYINKKFSNIHIMLSSVYNSIYCIIKCTQLCNYRHVAIILCIQINICAKIFNIYNILSTVYNSIYLHKIFKYILCYQVYTTR